MYKTCLACNGHGFIEPFRFSCDHCGGTGKISIQRYYFKVTTGSQVKYIYVDDEYQVAIMRMICRYANTWVRLRDKGEHEYIPIEP